MCMVSIYLSTKSGASNHSPYYNSKVSWRKKNKSSIENFICSTAQIQEVESRSAWTIGDFPREAQKLEEKQHFYITKYLDLTSLLPTLWPEAN